MPHVRQQIRNKVFDLVSSLQTTGKNAYKSRKYPVREEKLPGLCVFTVLEEIDDEEGKVEQLQLRDVYINVCGYDKVVAGLDDSLDDIAAEVETAIFADRFLSDLVKALDLVSTDITLGVEQEIPVGEIALTFKVQCFTDEGAPEIAI